MKVGNFLKNSGWLAVATAMVFTAMPAQAQDGRRDRGERSQVQRGGDRGGGGWQQQRTRPQMPDRTQRAERPRVERPASQIPRPPQATAPQQQQWRGGDRDRNSGVRAPDRQNDARGEWRGNDRRDDRRPDANRPSWQQRGNDRNDGRWDGRRDDRRDWNQRDGRDNRWQNDRRWQDNRRDAYRDGYRASQRDQRAWDNRWRDNRRYDWQNYRARNRTVFNIGVYSSPYRGYTYRRIGTGFRLNSLFYSNRYWINDPWAYRLPPAYGDYRWVRYYNDVMLVDVYTGQVVDVIYDFFW